MNRDWLIEDRESCTCDICQGMCGSPCWPLPEEIQGIFDAGFGHRFVKGTWFGGPEQGWEEIDVIVPDFLWLSPGRRCTFQQTDGLCQLHGICKPYEGRVAIHGRYSDQRDKIGKAWNTDVGQRAVALWNSEVG